MLNVTQHRPEEQVQCTQILTYEMMDRWVGGDLPRARSY